MQDAYSHVLIHPDSMKYLRFAIKNKVYKFRVLPFGLNTASQVFTRLGHRVAAYPSSGDIGNPVSQRLVDISPRLPSVITQPEHGRPQVKQSEIRTRTSSGYPVSGASVTLGSGESFPSNTQNSEDNGTHVPNILPENFVVHKSVPIHGITQLGLRSYPELRTQKCLFDILQHIYN